MTIRPAGYGDAEQVTAIYAPIVLDTHTSFEEIPPTVNEMRERIRSYCATYPWLVAVDGDLVLGYAYACEHRARPGYRWSVDSSVYVAETGRGRGIGKALYLNLFERLRRQRFQNVFAGIALPNDASVALHRSVGFTQIGTYRRVGYKRGAWIDTAWWQLRIAEDAGAPPEPLPPMQDSAD
ncbi:MAG: N-acetyltransferase family protein [Candidatus Eremiobacteraeota bacterium]|nr:N-acetyltransferase family protein [Candidatus Eremiobacteraeota bacterium]